MASMEGLFLSAPGLLWPVLLLLSVLFWGLFSQPARKSAATAGQLGVDCRTRLDQLQHLVKQCLFRTQSEAVLWQDICSSLHEESAGFVLACYGRDAGFSPLRLLAASHQLGWLLPASSDTAWLGQVWDQGECWHASRLTHDSPDWQQQAWQQGLHACALLPVSCHGERRALLLLLHPDPAMVSVMLQSAWRELADEISQGLKDLEGRSIQRVLLDNSRSGMVLMRNRMIESSNARLAVMLGYPSSTLNGSHCRLIYADERSYQQVGESYEHIRQQGSVQLSAIPLRRADGAIVLCDMSARALNDTNQALTVWTLEDVTEREQQAQRLRRLVRFHALLARANELSGLVEEQSVFYQSVCDAAVEQGGMLLAWVGCPEVNSGLFQVQAAAGATSYLDDVQISSRSDQPGGNGPTGCAWREAQPVFVARYRQPDLQHVWARQGDIYRFGSFAALPLHDQGQVVSVLTVYCPQEEVFDDETRAVLLELVSSIERGLQSLWQRQRIANLQALYHALMGEGDVVLQARSSEEMLRRTCDSLVDGTQFHAAWVGRPDGNGCLTTLVAAGCGVSDVYGHYLSLAQDVRQQGPLSVQAWQSASTCYLNHVQQQAPAGMLDFYREHGWQSVLATPVRRDGQPWAVLLFASPQPEAFDTQSVELCQTIAGLLGHGLDEMDLKQRLARLQEEDAYRARHDVLTDLPNRYAVEQHLVCSIAHTARQGRWLALAMIDLDDFKQVNDCHGHAAGDQLLQEFSRRMQSLLRHCDMLARQGGDEFILVIEDLDANNSHVQLGELLNRLHRAVEQPFAIAGANGLRVGMSVGVALCPQHGGDVSSLMRAADTAMYVAKQHKHGQLRWWQLAGEAVTV
ncbi:MAG: diguanylate cyclase [Aquitalea sp.]|nr:diguanylate cyclase [Aquitalea sp.]